jgi:hypothetical protein
VILAALTACLTVTTVPDHSPPAGASAPSEPSQLPPLPLASLDETLDVAGPTLNAAEIRPVRFGSWWTAEGTDR